MAEYHVIENDQSERPKIERHLRSIVHVSPRDSTVPSVSDALSTPKCLLVTGSWTTRLEKPLHYTYLKGFRVEQCPLFLKRKCTKKKPFRCFYWHFMNQRRRRPVKKRDGTFNYSPDVYCSQYDKNTGICPNGDDCVFLHRTVGDTERLFHLRYYKICICVYDTDYRGYCVKSNKIDPHCPFAHGIQDLRNPVYDIRELQTIGSAKTRAKRIPGLNSLRKEKNSLSKDLKWQDTNYLLTNYKTQECKKPSKLCQPGYAGSRCHNTRDRRRRPNKFKYSSTSCRNVKQGEKCGDPANCEDSDNCPYCHTRNEQQFHSEIHKSTKCEDILQTGYCPRGLFCAFALVDKEKLAVRDLAPDHTIDLVAILPIALASRTASTNSSQNQSNSGRDSEKEERGISGETEQASAGTIKGNYLTESQPLVDDYTPSSHRLPISIGTPISYSSSVNLSEESTSQFHKAPGAEREDRNASVRRQLQITDRDAELGTLEKECRKRDPVLSGESKYSSSCKTSRKTISPLTASFHRASSIVESVVGNAPDDLSLADINVEASLNRESINDSSNFNIPLSTGTTSSRLLSALDSLNIPCSSGVHKNKGLSIWSSQPISPLSRSLQLGSSLIETEKGIDKVAAEFYGHSSSFSSSKFGCPTIDLYDCGNPQNMSPSRMSAQKSLASSMAEFNSAESPVLSVTQRLREKDAGNKGNMRWGDEILQPRLMLATYEARKTETEKRSRREQLAQEQGGEVVATVTELQSKLHALSGGPFLHTLNKIVVLEALPLAKLKQLQEQLADDLMKLEKVVFHQCARTCVNCWKEARSVTGVPCSHFVLCSKGAPLQKTCSY